MSTNPSPGTGQLVDQVVEMKRVLGQFTRLIEISLTLNSTQNQEELLKFIIDTAADIMECEAVSIMLFDERTDQLRFAASSNSTPEELANIPVPLNNSIAGTIFQENRPILINNLEQDPRHFEKVGEQTNFDPQSLVGVPMQIHDKSIGVLEALNKKEGDFQREDIDILSIIASQAAVAINNAMLLVSLKKANAELSQADKIKSDFLAIASHELRTPLIHVLGYAQLLQEDAEGELSEHADKVMTSAMKLSTLVDDMTNLKFLELGSQELTTERIPIQQVVANAYKETLKTLEAKNQSCDIDLPSDPVFINGDQQKLEQAIINILNNAIRFTPNTGRIKINVSKDDTLAILEIQDSGIGIPINELEKIFDDFYQVENHLTRTYGGMGLGLAITRGIIELHNGHIWAKSAGKDAGSTFLMSIPLAD